MQEQSPSALTQANLASRELAPTRSPAVPERVRLRFPVKTLSSKERLAKKLEMCTNMGRRENITTAAGQRGRERKYVYMVLAHPIPHKGFWCSSGKFTGFRIQRD
jgi:hypothetical protein